MMLAKVEEDDLGEIADWLIAINSGKAGVECKGFCRQGRDNGKEHGNYHNGL